MGNLLVRTALLASASLIAAAVAAPPAYAQNAPEPSLGLQRYDIDIPAQDLGDALRALGRATRQNVVFDGAMVRAKRSVAVRGRFTPREALERMLGGSGLTVTSGSGGVLMVRQGQSAANPVLPGEGGDTSASDEIVVTGTNIRGSAPVGASPEVITREDFDRTGRGRLQDVIELLPQNFGGISEDYNQPSVSNQNYGAEIQLRGLGAGTTLTLVNGNRLPAGGSLGAFTDISSIPSAAIERVEVLTDGASSIYGSDAIGGVVNVILRQDLDGAESYARIATSEGDATEIQAAQLFGATWATGNVLVGYQYYQRDALLWGDRPYTASADLRPFGGSDFRRLSPAYVGAAPGNILDPVTRDVAYAIPDQDGTNLNADDLIAGAVNYRDLSYGTSLPSQEKHSVFLDASQRLGDRLAVRVDARYSRREAEYVVPTNAGSAVYSVPSTNPFYVNPFGTSDPVLVEYDLIGEIGPLRSTGTVETFLVNVTPKFEVSDDWTLTVNASYGQEDSDWLRTGRVDSAAIAAALADPDPATALNVFGNGTANNPATLAAIMRDDDFDQARNTTWSARAAFDGPLLDLPAGSVLAAVGGEFHRDSLEVVSNFSSDGPLSVSRENIALFGELRIPLLDEAMAVPAFRRLTLGVSGRFDDYSDYGSTFNPKFGLDWTLFEGMDFRATWGTSFRAPPFYLSNIAGINRTLYGTEAVQDPASPTGSSNILYITGARPDLTEETATVWSAGVDFRPVRALKASVTYFDIDYRNKIESPGSFRSILANEDQYLGTDIINRNPTAAEIDAICSSPDFRGACPDVVGAILDTRRQNVALQRVDGIDFSLEAQGEVLALEAFARLSGTYLLHFERAITPVAEVADLRDTYENPPSLRLRATGGLTKGPFSLNGAINHTGGYEGISEPIAAWTTFDIGLGFRLSDDPDRFLGGSSIRLDVTNLTNEPPPFVDAFLQPYDSANASILGRTVSLQLRAVW